MDADNSEVFDYDKCRFFRILESAEYRLEFEFIQQQQGVIICPLKMSPKPPSADLINRHLFLPSPFYKNHYIPLNSLLYLSSLKSSTNSVPMDHYQHIYLILNDASKPNQPSSNELLLMFSGQRICSNVKLFNIQSAYTENNKSYKILIVDRVLNFKLSKKLVPNQIHSENNEDFDEANLIPEQNSNLIENNESYKLNRRVSLLPRRDSSFNRTISVYYNIEDVRTFGQSIDLMHDSQFSEADDSDDKQLVKKPPKKTIIGQELLSELELFRKTYIILPNHLDHCAKQLHQIYSKYVRKFIYSYKKINGVNEIDNNADLMISIACENVIVGCLFPKLWANVVLMNEEDDEVLVIKCRKLFEYLDLNGANKLEACGDFFKIEKFFFMVNEQLVLKEFKQLALLNNPYEKLESIKTIVDLITNELTVLATGRLGGAGSVVTSDSLVPLLAYFIIKSNIDCLHSICFFIEKFHFSTLPNKFSTASSSTYLAELAFFMASFKAALQVIETSHVF